MSPDLAEHYIDVLCKQGFHVRDQTYEWGFEEKRICPQWRSVQKYVNNEYGTQKRGRKPLLDDNGRRWLRQFALINPKTRLEDMRLALFRWQNVFLSAPRISTILREEGLSRHKIK